MRRYLWLFACATAVIVAAATASASTDAPASRTLAAATPAASPFAASWADVPLTSAARRARGIVVFGQEQDIDGYNTVLTCCNEFWAGVQTVPVIRGAYLVNARLQHQLDLVVSAKATSRTLSYTIRPNASWNWGGRKIPVTYRDFVYTWQQVVDPRNSLVSRDGYDQITGFTHRGTKQITFTWKKPFADWQDLFAMVYPSAALAGLDFNKTWASCICGSNGAPVSDGPFLLTNYTKGQGSTLRANPYWSGRKPLLKEVDFKILADTNTEIQAMRDGEVDAINPTFGSSLSQLEGVAGITFNQVPGLFQEHIDIQFGSKGDPLLRARWMRQALMMGIDRRAIIKTVYGTLVGNTTPLDNIVYYQSDAGYRPDFHKWDFDPKHSLALLEKHCTGGPATVSQSNTLTWRCAGRPATFRFTWTASNATRTAQAAIVKQQLRSIGIEIVDRPQPANVVFGPSGIPSGDYDLANFAWVTSPDPSAYVPTWSCGGASNYLNYCNRAATKLLEASNSELDPAKRLKEFQAADALMANDVPTIPMYSRPNPLIWKSRLLGMKNNASLAGFGWNMEYWRWKP
jgi:peptide/nickel transport system substrate-binding protein